VLDKPVPIGCGLGLLSVLDGVVWVFLWQQVFVVVGTECSTWFLLESLILAQDERWRRA
jgi:hypothetical protein